MEEGKIKLRALDGNEDEDNEDYEGEEEDEEDVARMTPTTTDSKFT